MAKSDYTRGQLEKLGGFVAMPFIVIDSAAYRALSPSAIKLLLDVARQYTGRNNGRLTPSYGLLRERGWKSSATLNQAKKELRESRLVTVTRQGTRKKDTCELWALNWFGLDWRKDMEIDPAGHDYMGFLDIQDAKIDPIPERRKRPHLEAVA